MSIIYISSETVSFFLPLALRAASTLRPLAVDIRLRKPCLFLLFRFDGWNVLFISFFLDCKNRLFFYSDKYITKKLSLFLPNSE